MSDPNRRARGLWVAFTYPQKPKHMDRRHPRNVPSRPLVLIVDDHDDTRELYVQSLSALGFEAIAAGDCAEAARRAWESHPDIVVTDLTLRGGDGWQLIEDLRREARTRDIPIVLLTGHAAQSLRERAEREGCAEYFVKPCLPEELAAALRQVLDRTIGHEGVPASHVTATCDRGDNVTTD
jgi:two-component system, cell cycle response regulator DivK